MKIVGLITEYNPFHNGHLYHIEKAKEITGADAVIAVMSGNYVQRGVPAIMPKHLRAEVALEAGVSAVMELPVCYSTGSAEYFAAGALSILEKLNCVDAICFGSECGDYNTLEKIARVTADEPEEYQFSLKEAIRKGLSFPRSRQLAIQNYFKDDTLGAVLEQPNNILGIEYIKALYKRNSKIKCYTIKRIVSGYHDEKLSPSYSSASAIRKLLAYTSHSIHLGEDGVFDEPALSEVLTRLEDQVPPACIQLLEENHRVRYPVYANDFSLLLKYKLLTESKESLVKYLDITEDLANRIMNQADELISFDQFCDLLKTREMTYTRISRSLLHILLDIKTSDLLTYHEHGDCQYARILGFRKDCTSVLSHLKECTLIPLITRPSQTDRLCETGLQMLSQDIFASDLYESIITEKFKLPFINEYLHQIIKI